MDRDQQTLQIMQIMKIVIMLKMIILRKTRMVMMTMRVNLGRKGLLLFIVGRGKKSQNQKSVLLNYTVVLLAILNHEN